MVSARVSRRGRRAVPRSAAPPRRGGSSFLAGSVRGGVLAQARGEYGDLGFPGKCCLGPGGVGEFRAGFLSTFGVFSDAQDVHVGVVQGGHRAAGKTPPGGGGAGFWWT